MTNMISTVYRRLIILEPEVITAKSYLGNKRGVEGFIKKAKHYTILDPPVFAEAF